MCARSPIGTKPAWIVCVRKILEAGNASSRLSETESLGRAERSQAVESDEPLNAFFLAPPATIQSSFSHSKSMTLLPLGDSKSFGRSPPGNA